VLAGFSACVDLLYRLDTGTLDALAEAAVTGPGAAVRGFAAETLDRIGHGRDGEIFVPHRHEVEPWLAGLLGEPAGAQVGGTGAQAAWSLAVLGAPSVLALADRSPRQLAVLHPAIGIRTGSATGPVGRVTPTGEPAKPPHYILEFTAGSRWSGGRVPRTSRIIVRLAEDGVERDADFAAAAATLAAGAGAGLVSGLNGIPATDLTSRAWVREVVAGWRAGGLHTIHLELAEYVGAGALPALVREYAGLATSVGLSLAELAAFDAGDDPALAAHRMATGFGLGRVVVHADTWSLAVHRDDPAAATAALQAGNLLAAARARAGRPSGELRVAADAGFAAVRPASRRLGAGWRVDCVPTPYLARPAATIGLGDTFVAGLLLASSLAQRGVTAPAP
jgi:ADP-dependent phosphofructokinase/glucokinase